MDRMETGRAVLREMMGEEFLARRDEQSELVQRDDPGLLRRGLLRDGLVASWHRSQAAQHPEHRDAGGAEPGPAAAHAYRRCLNNGCSVDELREILLHSAVYAGLPPLSKASRLPRRCSKPRACSTERRPQPMHQGRKNMRIRALAVAAMTLAAPLAVSAQDYPSDTVRMVIPFTAGGSNDLIGRYLADALGGTGTPTSSSRIGPARGRRSGRPMSRRPSPTGTRCSSSRGPSRPTRPPSPTCPSTR